MGEGEGRSAAPPRPCIFLHGNRIAGKLLLLNSFDILRLFVVRQKLRERERERKLLLFQKGNDIAILLGNNVSPSTFFYYLFFGYVKCLTYPRKVYVTFEIKLRLEFSFLLSLFVEDFFRVILIIVSVIPFKL